MRLIRKVQKIIRKLNMAKEYDKKLIEELKKEHNTLYELLNQIYSELNNKKYEKVLKKLNTFKKELKEHITFEDEYFYPYVKIKYKYVPDILEIIETKQEEMKKISNFIETFTKKFSTKEQLRNGVFKKELDNIKKALVDRVNFEENQLYSYY